MLFSDCNKKDVTCVYSERNITYNSNNINTILNGNGTSMVCTINVNRDKTSYKRGYYEIRALLGRASSGLKRRRYELDYFRRLFGSIKTYAQGLSIRTLRLSFGNVGTLRINTRVIFITIGINGYLNRNLTTSIMGSLFGDGFIVRGRFPFLGLGLLIKKHFFSTLFSYLESFTLSRTID